ncbi:MAG TPA: polymer-forming cytoskeletal protein [Pyrinomonadaceae bacterium]|nr:polymer-forming cytoskeletal protein [Pyrinomonadaceae bacterium]
MFRMGKNASTDQTDTEHTNDNQTAQYNSSRSYGQSYQQPQPAPPAQASVSNSGTRAVTESESLARDIKDGNLSGYVGNGTVLTGEANFKMMLRVDGHLSGRVSSEDGTLIVGTNGEVDANIDVAVAVVHGTVNGDIVASQRLELGRAAKVNGNIQTPSLVIEQGAVFEGSCRMMQQKAAVEERARGAAASSGASESYDSEALDTSGMEAVSDTSSTDDSTDLSSYSDVAS